MPARLKAQSANSAGSDNRGWIENSNQYTHMLLAVVFNHHTEIASRRGLADYDTKISQPNCADQDAERHETEAVLEKLKAAAGEHQQEEVEQDLKIMIRRTEL